MKFKSSVEVQAGVIDSGGSIGLAGQILSSNGSNVVWTNEAPAANRVEHLAKAGVAINKGQAVYVTGANGTNMIVGLASNLTEGTSSKTMGLMGATTALNGFANVVAEGLLDGFDTSAGVAGDPVWLGEGGNLIYGLVNKPYAPKHLVFIGIVTRSNANTGEIFINVQNGFELNEIHDVDLKTTVPISGDILGFNGSLWVNKTIAGWLGYTPAPASGSANYIQNGTTQQTANFNIIGVGKITNTNAFPLELNRGLDVKVVGNASVGIKLGTLDGSTYKEGIVLFGQLNANGLDGRMLMQVRNNNIMETKLSIENTGAATFYSSVTANDNIFINRLGSTNINFQQAGVLKWKAGYASSITSFVFNNGTNDILALANSGAATFSSSVTATGLNSTGASNFATTSGNVGVGTISAATKLEVKNVGETAIQLNDNDNQKYRIFTRASDGVFGFYDATNPITFFRRTTLTGKLSINEGYGNLLVGSTTDDGSKLQVNGDISVSDSTPLIKLTSAGATYANGKFSVYSSAGVYQGGLVVNVNPGVSAASLEFPNTGGSSGSWVNAASSNVSFAFGGITSISAYVTSTGIGIGVLPTAALDVVGSYKHLFPGLPSGVGTVVAKTIAYSTSPYGLVTRAYSDGLFSIQCERESTPTQVFNIGLQPTGGNVLIGATASDGSKLQVNGGISTTHVGIGITTTTVQPLAVKTATGGSAIYIKGRTHASNDDFAGIEFIKSGSTTRNALIAGTSTGLIFQGAASFNSTVAATSFNGGAALTGTPTAPTAAAGTNTTQIATTAFVQSTRPYKVYTALVTQSGTAAPTAIILDNALGGIPVWSRNGAGLYQATLAGAFVNLKTATVTTTPSSGATVTSLRLSNNVITLNSFNNAGSGTDGLISEMFYEIRVYN